jgi:dienelactone hydrolase
MDDTMTLRGVARRAALFLAVLSMAAASAAAQSVSTVRASVNHDASITVVVHTPAGDGPFPLAVISHGAPRSVAQRFVLGESVHWDHARAFVARGFVVAVPIRRGYGSASEPWVEGYGDCTAPDYRAAGEATAADIAAAVRALSRVPAVDSTRVILMGMSAGGWGSVAAAAQGLPGIRAVLNFGGGRGSLGRASVCGGDDSLATAAAQFGARSPPIPQLWVYAENDTFFGPALTRKMHAAFTTAGGKAEYLLVPPHGNDGHFYFNDIAAWESRVDQFLKHTGLMR